MNPVLPVQLIKVGGLGADEGIQVPLFRLPFLGGRDGFAPPGGFYVTKDGEFGVAIDARMSAEEAQPFVAEELRKNAPLIAAALAAREGKDEKPRDARTTVS
jgi:hypothetical protein